MYLERSDSCRANVDVHNSVHDAFIDDEANASDSLRSICRSNVELVSGSGPSGVRSRLCSRFAESDDVVLETVHLVERRHEQILGRGVL